MKIRLTGQSLRLRLTQSEVSRLGLGKPVTEAIAFPGDARLECILQPSPSASLISVTLRASSMRVLVSDRQLYEWAASDHVGIEACVRVDQLTSINVLIEKDFQCLDNRPEDTDAFPNPKARRGVVA